VDLRVRLWVQVLIAGLAWMSSANANSQPYAPADDAIIIETLPAAADPKLTKLAAERRELLRATGSLEQVLPVVRGLIDAARRNGDPRYLGQAERLLQPWLRNAASTPTQVRILQATIQQSLHRFDAALDELKPVLAADPWNAQALVTRATIFQVRGRYAEAEGDCRQLSRNGGPVAAELCLASIAAVTGRATAATALLQHTLAETPDEELPVRVWALTLLAESAVRAGANDDAERYFVTAHQLDPQDRYLLAGYCDLLLERGRAAEVLTVTEGDDADDNLLLRRALAMQQTRDARLAATESVLAERFALQRQRGDVTHLREESRWQLALRNDAGMALQLAQQNWQQQREPADVRVLLESARATRDQAALTTVRKWLLQSGLQDHRLGQVAG
jgi:tetratricopeptide (TPR) repeat protein